MNRFNFLLTVASTFLMQAKKAPVQEQAVSFFKLPQDGKPHKLIRTIEGFDQTAIAFPMTSHPVAGYENADKKSLIGTAHFGIIAIYGVSTSRRPLSAQRNIIFYIEVQPESDESAVGSVVFSDGDIDGLRSRLDDVLRIGRNLRSSGELGKLVKVSEKNGLSFRVWGPSETSRPVTFDIVSTNNKVQILSVPLEDIHKIINPLDAAVKWLFSQPS